MRRASVNLFAWRLFLLLCWTTSNIKNNAKEPLSKIARTIYNAESLPKGDLKNCLYVRGFSVLINPLYKKQ